MLPVDRDSQHVYQMSQAAVESQRGIICARQKLYVDQKIRRAGAALLESLHVEVVLRVHTWTRFVSRQGA